jgi:hypothetical protein
MKRSLLLLAQALVTAILLGWMFRDPSFREQAWTALRTAHAPWLAGAAAVAGLGCLLGFARWGIFVRMTGMRLSAWEIVRVGAVGLFFNSFLPGAVGGDAVKVGWLAARGHPLHSGLLSVVMDRMSGIGALALFSAAFMGTRADWLLRSPAVAALSHLLWGYLVLVILLISLSFVLAARGMVGRLPSRFPGRSQLVDFAATYSLFVGQWGHTLLAAGLSCVMLLAYFLTFFFCAMALGLTVPLRDFLAVMPVVDLVAALPVSLGGFGVREGAFVTLLGQLCGVPGPEAVAVSFLGALLTLLWGCMGLLLLPGYRRDVQAR